MSDHQIFAITQALLAVVVIVGGGLLVALGKLPVDAVIGVIGMILGYYFGGISPITPNGKARNR